MEVVDIQVTNGADRMPVETGTTVNVRVFMLNDYHRADLFVKI